VTSPGRPAALYLTPRVPWPADDGGRIVASQNLIAVAEEYDTTLLTFAPPGGRLEVPQDPEARGVRVVAVPFSPPSVWISASQGLGGRWPYTLARYRSAEFDRTVRTEIARRRPRFVYVQSLHMATYVDAFDGVPMVLREQNVEFLWMERYARSQGISPRGIYARLQATKLRRTEAALCGRAALVLAMHEAEARAIRQLSPQTRVEVLPVGVDFGTSLKRAPAAPPRILLAASFLWEPNVDGAIRFLREGWPRLRGTSAILRVAGKAPPPRLRDVCNAVGAELVADVPSMAEEYARAALLVVPLWVGAGARVKVVEALAAGLPVAATPTAVEGLGLESGRHYLLGNDPEGLANAAAAILASPARAASLSAEGHALARTEWSLSAVAERQSRYLTSLTAQARGPR
jgi:glycosyltransferase involved in cell wall biosynthesis